MNKRRRGVAVVLTMLLSATPLHSVAQQSGEAEVLDELDTVLVNGQKVTRKPSIIISWMRRLVGQFSYEGFVDLHGQGNLEDQLPVRGLGDCVGFGAAPAVQCEINLTWPDANTESRAAMAGGITSLSPAMIMYGFEPDELAIRYQLVDSAGMAEGGLGFVSGDTATFKTTCVNTPVGCQRTIRIIANPDLKQIHMQIDVGRNGKTFLAFRLLLRRLAPDPSGEISGRKP